ADGGTGLVIGPPDPLRLGGGPGGLVHLAAAAHAAAVGVPAAPHREPAAAVHPRVAVARPDDGTPHPAAFSGVETLRKRRWVRRAVVGDRKSTRLNSSHVKTSYAVFCLKKKKTPRPRAARRRTGTAGHPRR